MGICCGQSRWYAIRHFISYEVFESENAEAVGSKDKGEMVDPLRHARIPPPYGPIIRRSEKCKIYVKTKHQNHLWCERYEPKIPK